MLLIAALWKSIIFIYLLNINILDNSYNPFSFKIFLLIFILFIFGSNLAEAIIVLANSGLIAPLEKSYTKGISANTFSSFKFSESNLFIYFIKGEFLFW